MKKLLVFFLVLVTCLAVFAACNDKPEKPAVTYKLDKAVAYVKSLYIGEEVKPEGSDVGVITKYADFERVSSVPIAGVIYNVEWSVSETDTSKVKVIKGSGTTATVIDVNEKTAEDINFILTATVKAGDGTSQTLTFNVVVPKYDVISFEDYMAAEEGDQVTVSGIVVAINSKAAGNSRNHIFLADADGKGGYYSYQMDQDPVKDLGIEIGMTVAVSGPVAPYSGMQEIKGGVARIIDKNKKDVAPVDITELFKTGASLKNYVGLPVTIKGVEIGSQDLATATSQYLNFSLNGAESYLRTYVTDFPTTLSIVTDADGNVTSADKTAIDTAHAEKFGWTANVTGILVLYNSNPYLIPMSTDCFEYIELVQKTDAEKVATELDALTMGSAFSADTVIDLPLAGKYFNNVTLSWASDKDCAVVADGKLTITVPDDATTLTLTVTATCGDVSETKTFEIKLAKGPIPLGDVLNMADGTKIIVQGTVSEINTAWSDKYGNISVTITDGTNSLYVFRLKTNVKVGDVITVTGEMSTYNGARQVAAGATATIDDPAPVEVTIPEAAELADGTRIIVTGTVKEINTAWSDQYGNITVTIEDADGNTLYIYRLATNVNVGDFVTITGKMGTYNNKRQVAQGATAVIGEPEAPSVISIADALAAADGTDVIVKGTVSEINTEWSDTYGNISVTITDGTDSLYVFRLATNVKVGDVITITGKMGTYNDARQIAQGATAVIE